jgi:coatomer subunit beta
VEDLGKATGAAEVWEDFISNLSRISQLTGISCSAAVISSFSALLGFSDPICAEAFVMMHGFDIMLGVYTS